MQNKELMELAEDFAKRTGWVNDKGFQVAHYQDIAKAMIAFHKAALSKASGGA